MDDTIYRKAAIDALSHCQTYLFDSRDDDKKISLEDAGYALEQLPPAQPEKTQLSEEDATSDCINRKAAIDAILEQSTHESVRELYEYTVEYPTAHWDRGLCDAIDAVLAVDGVPSAQPEILACGEGELIVQPEHHAENILAYAHDMGVSVEQAEKELRVVQSERKTGKWEQVEVSYLADMDAEIKESMAIASMFCPKCKRYHNEVYMYGNPTYGVNFCPNCGAKMEG